jgi:hypothetical protein
MRAVLILVATTSVCLFLSGRDAAPSVLLLHPEQAPVATREEPAKVVKLFMTGGAEYNPVHPGESQAAEPGALKSAKKLAKFAGQHSEAGKMILDPYSAQPAEADYVDNLAAGNSRAGRREARNERLRTQKLVEQETAGEVGKQFDDVYAKKHWFESSDANSDAVPHDDIPKLKAQAADAIPTTPKLSEMTQDAEAKVLDREAGLQNPLAAPQNSGGMAASIKLAGNDKAEAKVIAAINMAGDQGIKKQDADVAEGMALLNAGPNDPVDRAAGKVEQVEQSPDVSARDVHKKGLSAADLALLQDARSRQAQDDGVPLRDFPSAPQLTSSQSLAAKRQVLEGAQGEKEIRAEYSPIGVVSAAKFLKDPETFDKSLNGDAMDKWKVNLLALQVQKKYKH